MNKPIKCYCSIVECGKGELCSCQYLKKDIIAKHIPLSTLSLGIFTDSAPRPGQS